MDKIILVFYVNVGNRDNLEITEYLTEIRKQIKNDISVDYIIPIRTGETRIECLNPKLVSEEDYKQAKDLLDRNQKIVDDFINSKTQ